MMFSGQTILLALLACLSAHAQHGQPRAAFLGTHESDPEKIARLEAQVKALTERLDAKDKAEAAEKAGPEAPTDPAMVPMSVDTTKATQLSLPTSQLATTTTVPATISAVAQPEAPSLLVPTAAPGPATTALPPLPALVMPPTQGFQFHKSVPGDNSWGVPMASSTVTLDNGKTLTYDDVIFGMNRLWEDLGIWTQQRWHGVPFLQNPLDSFAIQELLWAEKPDLVIEIGTHTGGSALYFAEVMKDYNENSLFVTIDPSAMSFAVQVDVPKGKLAKNIVFIKGLSNSAAVVAQVKQLAKDRKKVFVIQDGNHAKDAVLWDLGFYDEIVTVGGYFIVQDTILDRSNAPTQSAFSAVHTFMAGKGMGRYVVDKRYEHLLFSTNHQGYLRKIAA